MIPDADVFNWIVAPISRAILYIGEEMRERPRQWQYYDHSLGRKHQ